MKKLLVLLFSILLSFNSHGGLFDKTVCVETDAQERDGLIYLPNKTKPFSGKNLCEYESGQYMSQGKYKDGKKNDDWTEWKKNGQIKFERTYDNGKEIGNDGSIITRNTNDQITSKEYYKDDNLVSDITLWYENGELREEGSYINGKKNGKFTFWNENGQIKFERTYKVGKEMGSDGSVITRNTYDQITSKKYYRMINKDGYLVNETDYIFYPDSEQIMFEGNKKNGITNGPITTWFENGQKWSEGYDKDGKMHGKFTMWHENGQKASEDNLIDGRRNGKLTAWRANGSKIFEATYKFDKLHGKQGFWYDKKDDWRDDGMIKSISSWKDGKLDGKQTEYADDFNIRLISEKIYKDGECISGDCPS